MTWSTWQNSQFPSIIKSDAFSHSLVLKINIQFSFHALVNVAPIINRFFLSLSVYEVFSSVAVSSNNSLIRTFK